MLVVQRANAKTCCYALAEVVVAVAEVAGAAVVGWAGVAVAAAVVAAEDWAGAAAVAAGWEAVAVAGRVEAARVHNPAPGKAVQPWLTWQHSHPWWQSS